MFLAGLSVNELFEIAAVTRICPNKGYIFHNKLQNTWTAILKIITFLCLMPRRLVPKANGKSKIKANEQKAI